MFDSGVTATTTGAAAAAASFFASSGFWTLYPLIFLLILMAISCSLKGGVGGRARGPRAGSWFVPDPPPGGGGPDRDGAQRLRAAFFAVDLRAPAFFAGALRAAV